MIDDAAIPSAAVPRVYSRDEHLVDAIIHVAGVLFAINGGLWLLWHVTGLPAAFSVSVYCAGLLAMIVTSAAYNLTPLHRPSKQVLRRLDHSAIFIMIAATYTPFAANRLADFEGHIVLAAIWICAGVGIALKMLFPRRLEIFSIALYLAMGWMAITVLRPLAASVGQLDFCLLVAGGVVYTCGVVFYLLDRIPFHKAIWHAFVLFAAMLHFFAISFEFAA